MCYMVQSLQPFNVHFRVRNLISKFLAWLYLKLNRINDTLCINRHYVDVHGYDASIAHAPDADDEMPDGALCTG